MMNKDEFIVFTIREGLLNDSDNIWVDINLGNISIQANVKIFDIYGEKHEEQYPFEISEEIESDTEHEAWDYLYDDYINKFKALELEVQNNDNQ